MEHYILFKLNNLISKEEFKEKINPNFQKMLDDIEGFSNFEIYLNQIDSESNFDIMVKMDMTYDALLNYIDHPLHLKLKNDNNKYVIKKAVFDR